MKKNDFIFYVSVMLLFSYLSTEKATAQTTQLKSLKETFKNDFLDWHCNERRTN